MRSSAPSTSRLTETAFFTLTVQPRLEVTAIAPLPGDATSGATDVNDAGQATVKSKTSSPASDNGAVWSGGELDPIGTGGVFPNAINDSAVVAGSNKPSTFDFDAFSCLFRAAACSGGCLRPRRARWHGLVRERHQQRRD